MKPFPTLQSLIDRYEHNVAILAKCEQRYFDKRARVLAKIVKRDIPELTRVVLVNRDIMFQPQQALRKLKTPDGNLCFDNLSTTDHAVSCELSRSTYHGNTVHSRSLRG